MVENQIHRVRRLVWLGVATSFFGALIAVGASWLLYEQTSTLLTDNLRERLLTISATEAVNISAADLEALRTREDWQKPEWERVVNSLHAAKYANRNTVFMYIFRKTAADPTQMEFVADADSINPYANTDSTPENDVDVNRDGKVEPDGPDKLQWPGQPYPEAVDIPEAFEAYNGPLTVKDLYTDDYGTVLTGYAPIKDSNGKVIAILGTDVKADDFFTITQQTLYPFLLFITFLVLTIAVLSGILIFTWRNRARTLAEVDRMKSEFLSIASHDLRAPLTVIRNFMSLLMDGSYGEFPEKSRDGIKQVFERATDMAKMVDNYLNISRIEQGVMKYEFTDADLTKIVSDTCSLFKDVAEKKGLAFSAPQNGKPLMARVDAPKMAEVISLLVDNAIKYTPAGSVAIDIGQTLRAGKRYARITIKDTGAGITPETMPKLFKLFSTGSGAQRLNISSTGVGLYAAKAHVDAHKGRIWAESEGEGRGSTFIVELPAKS